MKQIICVFIICIFLFIIGSEDCNNQPPMRAVAVAETPDVLGFQIGSSYIISVVDWGNSNDHWYASNAFKKFHTEAAKVEKQGWIYNSIQISQTERSAWIVATFRK